MDLANQQGYGEAVCREPVARGHYLNTLYIQV